MQALAKTLLSSSRRTSLSAAFSTISAAASPKPLPTFIVYDYLADVCGLSPGLAAKASKQISHLRSSSNPDSVLHFLKHSVGFSDAQITKLVSVYPKLLCTKPLKTLAPKINAIRSMGFTDHDITVLISSNPVILKFIDAYDTADKNIGKKLLLLKECGISDSQIASLIRTTPRLISMGTNELRDYIKSAEDLGVRRGKGMFGSFLRSISGMKATTLRRKMDVLRSFGLSEEEVMSALRKAPAVLSLSRMNLRAKMKFFLEEVGCDASYIAAHPVLLAYSLQKRLVPRQRILKMIESRSQPRRDSDLYNKIMMGEKQFIERYIIPHEDSMPELLALYVADCSKEASL